MEPSGLWSHDTQRLETALRLLADVDARLADTSNPPALYRRFVQALVPVVADWCSVFELDGAVLRPVARFPEDCGPAAELEAAAARGADAARSGRSVLVGDVTAASGLLPASWSLMVVPAQSGSRCMAVVALAVAGPDRRYDPLHLGLAELLACELGVAIYHARLLRRLRVALRERHARDRYLRLIFRGLPGAVWATDRALRFTHASGRSMRQMGIDPVGLVGKEPYDFLGTRDPENRAIAHHHAALAGTPQSFEYQFRDRWFSVLLEPLYGPHRTIIGCIGAALDVTEHKAAAERLEKSERLLRDAQRAAHIGSFEWNVRANTAAWSDELQRIYGLEPGQLTGTLDGFLERVHPDDRQKTREVIFEATRTLRPFAYEHRVVRADGQTRELRTQGDVMRDEGGAPTRIVGTCWDVTELADATRSRERTLSLLRATIEATADGILVVDREGRVVIYNQRFLSLWGIPQELARRGDDEALLNFVTGQLESPEEFRRVVSERYANPEVESLDVVRFKDGRIFERYSGPQRVGEELVGRVWSFRDITERERLLRGALFLADATRLLGSLDVEPALEGVAHLAVPFLGQGCAVDLLGDGAPRRLVALSFDTLPPIARSLHPAVLAGHATTYELGAVAYLGVPLLTRGRVAGAITFASALPRRYGAAELELGEELARRAALALENARLFRQAQDALSARDELLSVAAHEIRGPVNAIHLSVQSLRKEAASPERLKKLLELIERQDRRLRQFVDELLDVGMLRNGRMVLEYSRVDLADVARESVTRLGSELSRSGSSLTVTAHGVVVGEWDRFRLEQVVTNLLSNAIKFGLGKPIELTIDAAGGLATLSVTDHGIGIGPIDARERIFKPFERAVPMRHYGGLGLGLHIVKSIVEALGGSIHVDSEVGRGSTFVVHLPQSPVGGSERGADAHLDG